MAGDRNAAEAPIPVAVWHEQELTAQVHVARIAVNVIAISSAQLLRTAKQSRRCLGRDVRVQVYHPHVVAGQLAYTIIIETVMPRSNAMRI